MNLIWIFDSELIHYCDVNDMAAEKARLNDPFAPEGGGVATEVVIVDVQPSSTVQQEGCKLAISEYICLLRCNSYRRYTPRHNVFPYISYWNTGTQFRGVQRRYQGKGKVACITVQKKY